MPKQENATRYAVKWEYRHFGITEAIGSANCKQPELLLQSWYMADTNDLLQQIREVVREEVKAETEPIKKDMATKQDIQRVEQNQARANTALEAVVTKADVLTLGAKIMKKDKEQDKDAMPIVV